MTLTRIVTFVPVLVVSCIVAWAILTSDTLAKLSETARENEAAVFALREIGGNR